MVLLMLLHVRVVAVVVVMVQVVLLLLLLMMAVVVLLLLLVLLLMLHELQLERRVGPDSGRPVVRQRGRSGGRRALVSRTGRSGGAVWYGLSRRLRWRQQRAGRDVRRSRPAASIQIRAAASRRVRLLLTSVILLLLYITMICNALKLHIFYDNVQFFFSRANMCYLGEFATKSLQSFALHSAHHSIDQRCI